MRHQIVVSTGYVLDRALFALPKDKRVAVERWLRGWDEARSIDEADYALVSYGKSGRTWLRTMLSQYLRVKFDLGEDAVLEFDNLQKLNADIPSVFFTHGNYVRNYLNDWTSRTPFYNKRVLLLVRDPRDIAISQYFQWKYRMKPHKKPLNFYPPHGAELSVYEFLKHQGGGLPAVLDFLEIWERELPKVEQSCVVRYEDMRQDTHAALTKIVSFLGVSGSDAEIDNAVRYAEFNNMKKLEENKQLRFVGQRMRPGDPNNPQSFKVRRAKVGGYRDYLEPDQIAEFDAMIDARGGDLFGYKAPKSDGRDQALTVDNAVDTLDHAS